MIAHLRGRLIEKSPTSSIIDCQGIGYEVFHTPFTAEKILENAQLHIHTHVREDVLQLYGFFSKDERDLFRQLIKISSVGPKLALGILSGIHFQDLIKAIQQQDHSQLQKIPGVGKRTAERLAVELKDKLKPIALSDEPVSRDSTELELESVLLNLGYQKSEVSKAILKARATDETFEKFPLEVMVKRALGELTSGSMSRSN